MDEFTDEEIQAVMDQIGKRAFANWADLPAHDKLMLRKGLQDLAVRWLRERRPERACPAGDGRPVVFPPRRHDDRPVAHTN